MISFEIHDLPKRINQSQGSNWRVNHAHRLKWRKLVMAATIKLRPKEPYKMATLTLIRCSSVCPDADGLVQSFKAVIDALVFNKILEDDSMAHIGMPTYKWIKAKPKQGKIIVSIYPVDTLD